MRILATINSKGDIKLRDLERFFEEAEYMTLRLVAVEGLFIELLGAAIEGSGNEGDLLGIAEVAIRDRMQAPVSSSEH